MQENRAYLRRQSLDALCRIWPQQGGPKAPAIAERLEAYLIVFMRDERPDAIKEFRTPWNSS